MNKVAHNIVKSKIDSNKTITVIQKCSNGLVWDKFIKKAKNVQENFLKTRFKYYSNN